MLLVFYLAQRLYCNNQGPGLLLPRCPSPGLGIWPLSLSPLFLPLAQIPASGPAALVTAMLGRPGPAPPAPRPPPPSWSSAARCPSAKLNVGREAGSPRFLEPAGHQVRSILPFAEPSPPSPRVPPGSDSHLCSPSVPTTAPEAGPESPPLFQAYAVAKFTALNCNKTRSLPTIETSPLLCSKLTLSPSSRL